MQVLLLLTLDPGLEREIEKAWEDATLIPLDSPESVLASLSTLESRPIVLVDTTCFPVPEKMDADIICLGEEVFPGLPLLERPVRAKELRSLASMMAISTGSGTSSLDGILPSPFAEFQRDAIHDLNNQFTTLQGNLMLLQEEMKDPALDDMADAATKALELIHWLEWLGDGEFASERIDPLSFITALAPLFFRLRQRKTVFEVNASDPAPLPLHVNPQKLLALLLVLVHRIPGEPEQCTVQITESDRKPSIRCSWPDHSEELLLPDIVTSWCTGLRARLTTSSASWQLHW
jgi:hypothetical protein